MERFYIFYATSMYNTSYRILKHQQDAEDAMHEGFIAAWKAFPRFDLSKDPEKWIKSMVINKSIDMLRKRKYCFEDLSQLTTYHQEEYESQELQQVDVDVIRDSLMQLSDGYRSVLSLYLIEGLDYDEIAEWLDVKPSSVRSHVSRGLKKLRDKLKKQHYEKDSDIFSQ
ncbi:MAG: sigma-70 family RNA polymerase sigma factor [Bacteroidales bacterium]